MNVKILLIFVVSVAFFALAATYRFHDSAHAMGMLKKGGGIARHPALLDRDRDSYMLIATAGVIPPYRGNARVVLEGDPTLTATFHNSEPAIDLGIHRHPAFIDNTYLDLRPKDRIGLWVKIKRIQTPTPLQTIAAAPDKPGSGAFPDCMSCEPGDKDAAVGKAGNPGSRQHKKGSGAVPAKGTAIAFYDAATNEPLLKIPIRFTGGAGGSDNEH